MKYREYGFPAVLSGQIPGKALRAFPGSFRNCSGISSGKSHYGCDSNLPKVVRRGCKRCFDHLEKWSPKSLWHQCHPVLHQCNPLLHQCNRLLVHIHHNTFCTLSVSGLCSRHFGPQQCGLNREIKYMNINKFGGLSRDWVGGKNSLVSVLVCFCRGHSWWEKHTNKNQENPRIVPGHPVKFLLLCFSLRWFFSPPNFNSVSNWVHCKRRVAVIFWEVFIQHGTF